jgi:PAS domain S-box-containing protein
MLSQPLAQMRMSYAWSLTAIVAAWACLTALQLYFDYRTTVRNFLAASERTADLLERHAQWGFEEALNVLERARALVEQWDRSSLPAGQVVSARLGDLVAGSEVVGSIWAMDENGASLVDHASPKPDSANAGTRDYFRIHAHGWTGLWIGPTSTGTVIPRSRFTMSLPLTGGDGEFRGVVVAGSDVEFFTKLYRLLRWSTSTDVALASQTGSILARWQGDRPSLPQGEAGDTMLTIRRQIEGFPVEVVVGFDPSASLAEWRRRSAGFTGVSGLTMLALIGLLFVGRRRAVARAQASEERLSEAQRHARIGSWEANRKSGEVWWSDTVYEILGLDRTFNPTIPSFLELVHPEDRSAVEAAAQAINATRTVDLVHRIIRPDGAVRHIRVRGKLLGKPDERPGWMAGTVQDVTEEQSAKLALESANGLLESVIENIPAMVFIKRAGDLRFEHLNAAGERLLGYSRPDVIGKTDYDLFPKDQAEFFTRTDRTVLASLGAMEIAEEPIRLKDGSVRYLRTAKSALRNPSGQATHLLGVSLDTTSSKLAEEKVKLLVRELNHRAKNLLQLVQVVARHTAADADPKEYAARLSQRLASLAASHDLLVRNEWRGVELSELARSQLAHFADLIGSRVTLNGPSCRLNAQAAQAIGMALHELATNAAKYGALSNEGGRVDFSWNLGPNAGGRALMMVWSEIGGPPLGREPSRAGFGWKILRDMISQALEGHVTIDRTPSGLVWSAVIPSKRALEEAGAASAEEASLSPEAPRPTELA